MKNIFILKCCFIFSLTYFYFISNSHCGAEYGNQAEKIIVDNILLSEKDNNDIILFQKAILIDKEKAVAIRKESLEKRVPCRGDIRCLANVYDISSRKYLDMINNGYLETDTPGMGSRVSASSAKNRGEEDLGAVRKIFKPSLGEEKEISNIFLVILLITGCCSFVITWKIFNFFISLHDSFHLSPFNYYCKKIGASLSVSFAFVYIFFSFFNSYF